MFKKSSKGYYYWEEFAKLGVINGFSTKSFGDMSRLNSKSGFAIENFCKSLGIDKKMVVGMEQVHGNKVSFVSRDDIGKVVPRTDGLISLESDKFLICKSADCVPVLFCDKQKKSFAVAHIGRRGAYMEIAKKLVLKMVNNRSKLQDILVGIGPSIRDCCYNLEKVHINNFIGKFAKWERKIVKIRGNKEFLSLQGLISLQLIESGIEKRNIKDSFVCTKDNYFDFYSYRGQGKTAARFIGIIGRYEKS